MEQIKKYIAVIMIVSMLVFRSVPTVAFAEGETTEQPAPTQTQQQETQSTSQQSTEQHHTPETPSTPDTPSAPNAPSAPGGDDSEEQQLRALYKQQYEKQQQEKAAKEAAAAAAAANAGAQTANSGQNNSGGVGDTSINTAPATSNASSVTTGNNNIATNGGNGNVVGNGTSASNVANGANSNNNSSASVVDNNNTNQNNSANVSNVLDQSANTGDNTASFNVGNSSINTEDANVTGTVVTAVNTNVDGLMVSEFNIADDHVGDVVLDFNANCVSGCAGGPVSANNSNNGAKSNNTANSSSEQNNNTFQNNDATVGSELTLSANSGDNKTSYNTGGDSNITTGDANVSANALTFANNNVAGDVIYGVVNIFGNLVGDIILTEEAMNAACGYSCANGTNASNTNNGANSTNNASSNHTTNDTTFQNNDASIENNILVDGNTGDNASSFNTDGTSTVSTGSTTVDANVLNVANTNVDGGNMWLVIVNEGGKWMGRLLGGPAGSMMAGSEGFEFAVDENGNVSADGGASNTGNGAGSDNTANTSSETNNTTTQNNKADVSNTLNLSANTGNNTASYNTGGDSNIKTGDAKIVANIVNFVNNNIKGTGKLVVTVVNVFGSWIGDFVTPGQQQDSNAPHNQQAVGGAQSANKPLVTPAPTTALTNASAVQAATATKTNTLASGYGNAWPESDTNTGYSAGVVEKAAKSAALVKGTQTSNDFFSDSESKVLNINLAWLLVIIPGAALVYTVNRFVIRRFV